MRFLHQLVRDPPAWVFSWSTDLAVPISDLQLLLYGGQTGDLYQMGDEATLTLKLEQSLVLQSALYPIVCIQVYFVSKKIHKEKGTVPIPPPLKQYRGQYISQQETLKKEGPFSCEKSLKSCSSCGFLVAPFYTIFSEGLGLTRGLGHLQTRFRFLW